MTRSMPIHSLAMTITAVSLALIAVAQPRPAVAQDVLIQGREAGVPPPAEILRILAEDTTAFRFERVWKQKAAAVWARRIEIEALLGARYTAAQLAGQGASLTGVLSVPVIPALYSDKSAPYTPAEYQERLFGNGSGAVSVSRLYSEMSRNVFTVSGDVLPWLKMPEATSYYEDGTRIGKVADFLLHALERADSVTDFGQYDNDGMDGVPNSGDDDGYVDVAAFIYPTVSATLSAVAGLESGRTGGLTDGHSAKRGGRLNPFTRTMLRPTAA